MRDFFKQIFQDIDGDYSAKRTVFLMFALSFLLLSIALVFRGVPPEMIDFAKGSQDKIADLLKWIGGFILAEQGAKFAPKGKE